VKKVLLDRPTVKSERPSSGLQLVWKKNWRTRELPLADWAGKLPKTHNITFFNLTEVGLFNTYVTL
jgi:hypothetical protein